MTKTYAFVVAGVVLELVIANIGFMLHDPWMAASGALPFLVLGPYVMNGGGEKK